MISALLCKFLKNEMKADSTEYEPGAITFFSLKPLTLTLNKSGSHININEEGLLKRFS